MIKLCLNIITKPFNWFQGCTNCNELNTQFVSSSFVAYPGAIVPALSYQSITSTYSNQGGVNINTICQ